MIRNTEGTEYTIGNSSVKIGKFTYGHEKMHVHEWGEGASLTIGKFCSLARNINIFLGGNHRTDWITTFPFGHIFNKELGGKGIVGHPATRGNITIANDVWIGTNVTIMSGVTIGNGAVIGANALVVKDVKPYEVVGGNPATHLKYRFEDAIIDKLLKLQWWDLPLNTIQRINQDLSTVPTIEQLTQLIDKIKHD